MTSSAPSTILPSGSSSFRNSTGSRLSFMDGSSHRLSVGSNRLSLLPGKNIAPPALPTPQFDSDELSARAATFTNDVNVAIQKIRTKMAENTEQWVQDTAEARALKKEKEEANAMSRIVQEYATQCEDMQQRRQVLQEQVAILRREVKAKREAKIALKKALEKQVLKNKPELASFESALALRIIGVREDHIGFVFTRINEQDWDQEYTITVDVSQHDYAVADCNPSLPELPSLIRYLNDTRDFYGFIKKVRKAFKDQSKK
ncbi:kinetochore-associated Ndc80 complex subunit spc25 [Mortierella sp. GBA43]|nr:kinetochore-associated Ndc80 complex subunit spc25 [Mortierella sp. GBA43]